MAVTRREFNRGILGAGAWMSLPASTQLVSPGAHSYERYTPINVMLPKQYNPPTDLTASASFPHKLTRATLDFLEKSFGSGRVPVWNKKFQAIDFEKRLTNIVYWILRGIAGFKKIHPIDPVWIVAQIMHESYFYEFAVSRSLAVGICQFITPTGHEYNMLCAGDRPEHGRAPYALPELAMREKDYFRIRRERRQFIRENAPAASYSEAQLLEHIAAGQGDEIREYAEEELAFQRKLDAFDAEAERAKDDFIKFMRANLEERDIFAQRDVEFLLTFDERTTYRKPILAMIQLLARCLRARNGNIIAAAAGYNAGLSRTIAEGIYKPYGKIPYYEETVNYVSQIVVLHHEISKRLA